MLNIAIATVPHEAQRYPTVGDWFWDREKRELTILVSDLNNWKYEFLIAIHEIVEAMLCQAAGVSQLDVDNFDMAFEKRRQKDDVSEPGDDPKAPYYKQHQTASFVERVVALDLNVNWESYEATIQALS